MTYYDPEPYNRYCRRDHLCAGRDPITRQPAPTPRPLCDTCAAILADIITGLPDTLTSLHEELARSYQSMPEAAPVAGGEPEPPLPIRENVDALIRTLVATMAEWAGRVRDVASLAPAPHAPHPDVSLRQSVRALQHRTSVLLALGPSVRTVRTPLHDPDAAPRPLDGADAAGEIFWLRHRARAITGQIRRTNRREEPCLTCGVPAGIHWDGEEIVVCQACGHRAEKIDHWINGDPDEPATDQQQPALQHAA